MKIKNIVISKQVESTENFKNIKKLIQNKKINLIIVTNEDILRIDKYTKIEIISPSDYLYSEINDNSIVFQLECYGKRTLFTGDISKEVENDLLESYNINVDILKVAHHGSKTSSGEEFLKRINPKISLIGVGKNNKFGHPNIETINNLKNVGSKIYRTDLNGEIMIEINRKRKYKS